MVRLEDRQFPAREGLESRVEETEITPTTEYQVGRGRPPRDTQWKKGGPSPNPRGRPRKNQSMLPDLRKTFERVMSKKVLVTRGDEQVLMTRLEIGFEELFDQFAKGDRYARRDLMEYAERLGIDFLGGQRKVIEEALTPNYRAILDSFLERQTGTGTVAAAAPALAPVELLDDDDSTDAMPPSPSPLPPEIKSEPEPNPAAPKPFARMTWTEKRAWYPEWYRAHPPR